MEANVRGNGANMKSNNASGANTTTKKNNATNANGANASAKKIGVIGAMEVEVEALVAQMKKDGGAKLTKAARLDFYEGMIADVPAVVVKSGVGKVNAALCADRLILEFGVTHIINTGVAGAAAKGLGVFDVVVSSDALYHDVDATVFGYEFCQIPQMEVYKFVADKKLVKAAEEAFAASGAAKNHTLVKGRVASGDQFVSSGAAKERIIKICKPACIEMEGAAIAHACWLNDIPFVIIRAMSDTADDAKSEYVFNEAEAAKESAEIVVNMFKLLND